MTDNTSDQPQDLSSLIQATTYQNVPPSWAVTQAFGNQDGVAQQADNPAGGNRNEGLSPATGNIPTAPTGNVQAEGVTPQGEEQPHGNDQPTIEGDPRDDLIRERDEIIAAQNREMEAATQQWHAQEQRRLQAIAQRQEQEFERSLQDLDPTEAQARRAQRNLALTQLRLRDVEGQLQQTRQQTQQQRQQDQVEAKKQVALYVAADVGIPLSLSHFLLGAESYEDMQAKASELAENLTPRQQAEVQQDQQVQQVYNRNNQGRFQPRATDDYEDNPAYAGGGDVAGGTVREGPAPGSGDLASLIANTGYQMVTIER